MKKLILTENQIDNLKLFLLFEGDRDAFKKFIEDTKKSFMDTINNYKPGDYITFTFGKIGKNGEWLQDTLSIITFKIINIEYSNILLEFVTSDGKKNHNFKNGEKLMLTTSSTLGISFKNQNAQVGFLPLIGEVDGQIKFGDAIIIPNFISYIITDSETRTNSIKASQDAHEKWLKANEKFNNSRVYEPSLLGMDNFFFFPKGYLAMDKTLAKFGLSIKDSDNIKVRVKELNGIKGIFGGGEELKHEGIYPAIYRNNEIVIHMNNVEFIFYIDKNKLATGGTFIFDTSYKLEGETPTPIESNEGKSKLNMVKL